MSSTPSSKTYDLVADCTGPKSATVTVRDLAVEVDAPEASGGRNRGSTPAEYLLATLAGCVNVTGIHVAREMGIDLDITAVRVSGDLDVSTFRTGEGDRAGYERIGVSVEVDTTADAAEIDAWRRETERCNPVLDTIACPTPVEVSISTA